MEPYRKLKAWDELSPSGKRYRKKRWEQALLKGPDVVWNGDLDMFDVDINVPGNLEVFGNISAKNLSVGGNLYVRGSFKQIGDEVMGYITVPTYITTNGAINVKGNMIIPNCRVGSFYLCVEGNLSGYSVIVGTIDVGGSIDLSEINSKSVIAGSNITAHKIYVSEEIQALNIYVSEDMSADYINCASLNVGGNLSTEEMDVQEILLSGSIIFYSDNRKSKFEVFGSGDVYICTLSGSQYKVFFKPKARA